MAEPTKMKNKGVSSQGILVSEPGDVENLASCTHKMGEWKAALGMQWVNIGTVLNSAIY